MQWTERMTAAYRNFPFAPPDYPGAPFRSRLPEAPYAGAPGWQCSVYYYWWEYLRRHAGYRETCLNGGKGAHAQLYRFFGDVHAGDFHAWWWQHYMLFTFVSEAQDITQSEKFYLDSEGIFLHVGYSRSRTEMINSVRAVLTKVRPERMEREIRKLYRCYPVGRPRLRSLHEHLQVWDARQSHPDADDAEIADLVGLTGLDRYDTGTIAELRAKDEYVDDLVRANRRARQLAVQRHLRIAQQYIENTADAEFPLRTVR